MEQLDPYDNVDHLMFSCPASPSKGICDYYLSAWAAYYANGMHHPTPSVSLPRVKDLSTMILAGEFTWGTPGTDTDPDDADITNLPFSAKPWHGRYYNILFVDGHVESVLAFNKTMMTNRYEGLGYDYNSQDP
jgi:prepilin-type processing-associated H-X9-DG protein